MKMLQAVLAVSLMLALGACSSVTSTMSDDRYLSAKEEKRQEYLAAIEEEDRILREKKEAEYQVGRPVIYERNGIFRTVQWDRKLGMIYIYPGKKTGLMSLDTHGVIAVRATPDGKIKYDADGRGGERPTTFLANVATEQGLGRVLLQGGFQVLSFGANGLLAADKIADSQPDCDGPNGCNNVFNGSMSVSGSTSQSVNHNQTNTSVGFGCTRNCGALGSQ